MHGGLARIVARREQAASVLAAAQDCVTGLKCLGFSQVTLDLEPLPCIEEPEPQIETDKMREETAQATSQNETETE